MNERFSFLKRFMTNIRHIYSYMVTARELVGLFCIYMYYCRTLSFAAIISNVK